MSNNNSIIGPLIGLGFGLIALKTLKTITAPKETRRPLDKKQIAIASTRMPAIVSYLTNLTEYYIDGEFFIPTDINGLDS
jgi:hypothetical protein